MSDPVVGEWRIDDKRGEGMAVRWERVPPPGPCTFPDGHTYVVDHMIYSRAYSVNVRCPRCRRPWQVVKFEEEAP